MKILRVKGTVCPDCGGFISGEEPPEAATWYRCGECEEVYEDFEEAKECCRE